MIKKAIQSVTNVGLLLKINAFSIFCKNILFALQMHAKRLRVFQFNFLISDNTRNMFLFNHIFCN